VLLVLLHLSEPAHALASLVFPVATYKVISSKAAAAAKEDASQNKRDLRTCRGKYKIIQVVSKVATIIITHGFTKERRKYIPA